ncbi:integrase core domain-containing protein [Yangia mangrovi]|uniref:Integrase core domain-containing protein n=1 Tax=Alloyangia mangrovi TaxID=1779329 RepID=A0ABT2KQB7_9RHOB|nr:integrase core domain-containing protein [Alloyangia mangrovi]
MYYGLAFTSHHFTIIVCNYGLKQEFITPHCPQQNGMVERFVRVLKEQCVRRHRSDSPSAIGDWIAFYNNRRSHQALAMVHPPRHSDYQLNLSKFCRVKTSS